MRDLLPEEAAYRRALARTVLGRFSLYGYRLVVSPAFELADVIEGGLGPLAASDVLRFIEPESGEVAVLQPDMTPAVARIVATRLRDRPPPYRLAYEGTVVRRRTSRAKKHRQIPQVGVELAGLVAPEGDLEILTLADDAVRAAGVRHFTIDLADAGIVRGLLEGVTADRAKASTHALARKDEAALREAAKDLPYEQCLLALPRLSGGREMLVDAVRVLAGTPAEMPARRLAALFDAACDRGLTSLRADAGDVREFAYYTGLIFSIYASGSGEPIGAGGRYDELLSRFGAPMPAIGVGLDLDALGIAVNGPELEVGVVVVGAPDDPRLHALRSRGVSAVAISEAESARAHAKAWRHALIWETQCIVRVSDDAVMASALGSSADDGADRIVLMLREHACRPS